MMEGKGAIDRFWTGAEVSPGRVVELKELGFLTPDLKHGPFFMDMSGAVLLESNELAVDMAEVILREQYSVIVLSLLLFLCSKIKIAGRCKGE